MPRRRFRPSTGQICWLAAVGVTAIGAALYLRYRVIEVSAVGLACDGGLRSWTCDFRRIATMMFNNSVFGYVALIGAALNLLHPSVVLFTVGLLAGGAGRRALQRNAFGIGAGAADPQPGATRTRARMNASASSATHSQSDCQFAKLSLKAT